jgi:hypothetical protein
MNGAGGKSQGKHVFYLKGSIFDLPSVFVIFKPLVTPQNEVRMREMDKFIVAGKEKLQRRAKGKSCGRRITHGKRNVTQEFDVNGNENELPLNVK